MFLTLKNASKTNSPVPPWALERIKIAFNVEELQETAVIGTEVTQHRSRGQNSNIFHAQVSTISPRVGSRSVPLCATQKRLQAGKRVGMDISESEGEALFKGEPGCG